MPRNWLICGLLLLGTTPARGAAEGVADRITLRDGSTVLGLVTSAPAGQRGAVEFLVRRDWAERHAANHLAEWDRAASARAAKAVEQRRERLSSWRGERERSPGVGADDKILRWIDGELGRLADPTAAARAALVPLRLPHGEVRRVERSPAAAGRVLRQAWVAGVREPEGLSLDELTDAVESRGLIVDPKAQPVSLDRLLPPGPEAEAVWLARRAATEIAIDDGLRFVRYQDTVLPDMGPGQQAPALNPGMVLSEVRRLLAPDDAQNRPDPLAEKLRAVAARGRIGAVVTRLVITPDLGGATVETTFWVRPPAGQWVAYGSRAATVRLDDLGADAGGGLAEDPQVKAAFGMLQSFGLGGAITPEMKQRGLRMGAATQKALGLARADFNRDLDAVMLPIFEPTAAARERRAGDVSPRSGREDRGLTPPARPETSGSKPKSKPAPRRSMLGPQGR